MSDIAQLITSFVSYQLLLSFIIITNVRIIARMELKECSLDLIETIHYDLEVEIFIGCIWVKRVFLSLYLNSKSLCEHVSSFVTHLCFIGCFSSLLYCY